MNVSFLKFPIVVMTIPPLKIAGGHVGTLHCSQVVHCSFFQLSFPILWSSERKKEKKINELIKLLEPPKSAQWCHFPDFKSKSWKISDDRKKWQGILRAKIWDCPKLMQKLLIKLEARRRDVICLICIVIYIYSFILGTYPLFFPLKQHP